MQESPQTFFRFGFFLAGRNDGTAAAGGDRRGDIDEKCLAAAWRMRPNRVHRSDRHGAAQDRRHDAG